MTDKEQIFATKSFVEFWKDKGSEKKESQLFWISLLSNIFGIDKPEEFIIFEEDVMLDHTSFIDGYISTTHVLIEQKSKTKDLRKPIKQSDGSSLTPFQQAKRYSLELPYSKRPRWIVTSNFKEFLIYDMENPIGEPEQLLLENLPKEYYRLQFLVEAENENIRKEMEVSLQAGELVGTLYDELLKQYVDPTKEDTLKSLNMLCVRLVFCLYAQDAGILGERKKFHNYLKESKVKDVRRALIDLFKVLDTKTEDRDPYLEESLASFPYVNGGLFADENIEIPNFNQTTVDLLLLNVSEGFNWSSISPTIFGAVFESTLNPKTRRSGGMHYTTIDNIHKIIDATFLDDLKEELEKIKSIAVDKTRTQKLQSFQTKLASLIFLDPACGSGNFLTETYLSLRRLENQVLEGLLAGQIVLGDSTSNPIKVSIEQFYGIEINDFAVTVAKTALWIAESQMLKETEDIVHMNLDFLPLKSYVNIYEGNALDLDWETVVSKRRLNYIIGNPPFVGKKEQTKEQKRELQNIYGKCPGSGNMDYVTAWYIKAAEYIQSTHIQVSFVSTNSITQGEQPSVLWKKLESLNVKIVFAYQSFNWASESTEEAAVYCVIISFSILPLIKERRIYRDYRYTLAKNINMYLLDAPDVIISSRSKPLCEVPKISYGSMPIDNNNLILLEDDVKALLEESESYIACTREYVGGDELLKGKKRWCLWLKDVNPAIYIKSKFIMNRIEANRNYRLNESDRPQTNKAAETPHLFGEIRQPNHGALVIPKVSSEDRRYIPICYVKPGVIINGSALMIPNASLYHFGILSSNVHNAWMRVVAGRLEMRYQYSASIVYNNFIWPNPTDEQISKIEVSAQEVLDARKKYPDITLANMYKEKNFLLCTDLKKAHDNLNRVVMQAYGFSSKQMTESACVSALMELYKNKIGK